MPDRRRHRGPHPEDRSLFAPEMIPSLRRAVVHLSWLFSNGYAEPSALKLVGDRFNLTERQRIAVRRCACSDNSLARRRRSMCGPDAIRGQPILIDGYNLLTTIECALGGGVILAARDGCFRDMASMHGTYRKVDETRPAIELAGRWLSGAGAGPCRWLLDSPVSNSGRLAAVMHECAASAGWPWEVQVIPDPDTLLAGSEHIIVTADSVVLDACGAWLNLARALVTATTPQAWIIDLSTV